MRSNKYIRLRDNVVVEAFQMTEERRWDNKDWPNWLNYAWNKPKEEVGAVFCDEADPKFLYVTFMPGFLDSYVQFGGWLYYVDGIVSFCAESTFKEWYRPALTAKETMERALTALSGDLNHNGVAEAKKLLKSWLKTNEESV